MSDGLKVIALISGGKDSIFSILHCRANGHEVVALANLYPETSPNSTTEPEAWTSEGLDCYLQEVSLDRYGENEDIESHMYQTVGHGVIPLYAGALNTPLYRQRIHGTAVNKSKTYQPPVPTAFDNSTASASPHQQQEAEPQPDEIESLLPLLRRIKAAHPSANALSTGAILSTYQRTRIESVAARLGLVPLAYLWQYPLLPPYTQMSLLRDMFAVGLDARIVKVASGGLDAQLLWENITEPRVMSKVAAGMRRVVGQEGLQIGAVVGEGGEFETLAVDGPKALFQRKIVVDESARRVMAEQGGTAFVKVVQARLAEKQGDGLGDQAIGDQPRTPDLWDSEFAEVLRLLRDGDPDAERVIDSGLRSEVSEPTEGRPLSTQLTSIQRGWQIPRTVVESESTVYVSNIVARGPSGHEKSNTATQASQIVSIIRAHLEQRELAASDIFFTVILLRSMASFGAVNEIYNTLFVHPNPPARVTVAVGDILSDGVDVAMSFAAELRPCIESANTGGVRISQEHRRTLHVQSLSYWAPANIGPYSQAAALRIPNFCTSLPHSHAAKAEPQDEGRNEIESEFDIVHVAGQIPLVPATMTLIASPNFREHAGLSLQHLFRVGRAMDVRWWCGGAVAFITGNTRSQVKARAKDVVQIWDCIHRLAKDHGEGRTEELEDDSEADVGDAALYRPWDSRAYALGAVGGVHEDLVQRSSLPDWDCVHPEAYTRVDEATSPTLIAVQVAELPRGAQVEWWSFGAAIQGASSRALVTGGGASCRIGRFRISWIKCLTFEGFCVALENLISRQQGNEMADQRTFVEIFSSHISNLTESMLMRSGAMVVPCTSVWDQDCMELFAALRLRRYEDNA